jgi:hypothetical protein
MNAMLQLKLAGLAGTAPDGQEWAAKYRYHLGATLAPLPFELFRLRDRRLSGLLDMDPDGKHPELDHTINRLCRELGY